MRKFLTFVVVGALALFPIIAFGQGTATITGKVTDDDGNPLPGANIVIKALALGAATDINGDFTFTVPAKYVQQQQVKMTARFIGFRHKTEVITLRPGTIAQDFALEVDVLDMDAVVVTGLVDETPKTKLPFSIGRIDQEILEHAPASSPENALRGKVAGVRVVRGTGQPGTSASVLLRAPTSINASGRSQNPLYIVDGVIIDPSISGNPMSDIPTEDIKNMEVVKGAAGASLYGSRAANGVIVINTNRGNELAINQTRIRVRNEFGFNNLERKLGINQHHGSKIFEGAAAYTDANGKQVTTGDFIDKDGNYVDPRLPGGRIPDNWVNSAGEEVTGIVFFDNPYKWVATGYDPHAPAGERLPRDASGNIIPPTLLSSPFDQLDRFFDPGQFISNSVSISRNMRSTNFLVSFGHLQESGIIDGIDGLSRKNVRLNLDHNFRESLTVGVTGMFSQTRRDIITDGGGPFFALTFIAPDADLSLRDEKGELYIQPDPKNVEDNPLYFIQNNDRESDRKRIMSSFNLRYAPTNWFNLESSFSYDRSDRGYESFYPVGYTSISVGPEITGRLILTPRLEETLNGSAIASLNRDFGDLSLRMKARGLFERAKSESQTGDGRDFAVQGVRSLSVANNEVSFLSSGRTEIRSNGYSLITALDYKDRYIVDFLVRRDGSSLFGPDERWATYYRASGAYRLSQEDWWFIPSLDEFKIRASYGTAGGRPRWSARFETWTVSAGTVSKGTLGNKELKPEFTKELELGLDFGLFNRLSVELTYAQSTGEDQLLPVPLAGYFGYSQQWRNAGTLETSTFEASLNASLLRNRDMTWTFGFNFDKSKQEITELNVPKHRSGPFFIKEGEDLGVMFGEQWVLSLDKLPAGIPANQFQVNDEGHTVWVGEGNSWRDGIAKDLWGTSTTLTDEYGVEHSYKWGLPIKQLEAEFVDGNFDKYTNFLRIGSVVPDFNLGIHSSFRYKGVSVYALVDAQIGGDIYCNTCQWGLRDDNRLAEADQFGKSDETKKPGVYHQTLYSINAVNSHFVESGEYLKLRELSVRYTFDRNQLSGVFGGLFQRLSIGVIGRNLFTITDYKSYDPEVGSTGFNFGSAAVARYDGFGYPNYRTFSGIVEFEL